MSAPQVRVHLCGPLRIELGDRRVERALPGRQGRLLFAYLLLERDRWVSREELAGLLWPDRVPPSAAGTLRALLSKLRAGLGKTAVTGSGELRIDLGDGAWIDVEAAISATERADRAIADGRWREAWGAAQVALSVASRRFLPDEEGDWVESKRRELEDVRLLALERLAEVALALGGSELAAGERCARAIVDSAPYRESGYLLLMRVLAARGNPAEAVRVYDRARTRLRDELGIPPAAELRALNERLLASDLTASDETPTHSEKMAVGLPPLLGAVERTPLIGRDNDLDRLIARFESARDSGPVAVTVTGEAGIGKTRMIRELARRVLGNDTVVLCGAALREASPYQPFLDALRQFVGDAPPGTLTALRVIDPPVLVRLLPELHEHGGSPPAEPTADEQTGRVRAFAGLTRMIEEIARHGTVMLALDDMHWGDPASVQLLAHLLRNLRPVPLFALIAYRPGEAPPILGQALHQARQRAPIDNVSLSPLNEQDVEELIRAWAGTGAPASFARDLRERSDGNPLFIGHLLRHLVGAGAIDPDLRRWASRRDILSLGVPHEVRELIELRLASFDDRARQVLNTAAVVGQEFTLGVVERAIGDTAGHALDALDAGLRGGLVAEAGAGAFRFTHALIREAIYAQLSIARRGRIHRAVGEAIQSLYAPGLSPHRDELALHFLAAARAGEDPAPAIAATLAAAEHARRLFANEQAEAHYSAALELLRQGADPEVSLRIHEGLGDMLAIRTQYREAVAAYHDALDATPCDQPLALARLERKTGRAHLRDRAGDAAREAFDRANRHLESAEDTEAATAEIIEVGLDRLTLLYWENETAAMGRLLARLHPLVEAGGTPAQRVRLLHSELVREVRRQRSRLSHRTVELTREALRNAETTADPALLATSRFQLGFALLLADDPEEALEHLQQAAELSAQTGELMLQARAMTYTSLAHRRRAKTLDTERAARDALDAATAANTPEYQAIARANLAWVAARIGDTERAREHAQFALTQFRNMPFRAAFWMPLALWPLLAAAVDQNDAAAATVYVEQLLDPENRPVPRAVASLLQAALDCQSDEPTQATRQLHRALQLGDGITLKTPAPTPSTR